MAHSPPSPAPPPLLLPRRQRESHKGDYGRVLFIGGSRGMAGAVSLAAISALKLGSGLVTAAIPDRCLETVAGFDPCLMTRPLADTPAGSLADGAVDDLGEWTEAFDALGVGPGMGTGSGSAAIVEWALARERSCALDADALNCLARMDEWQSRVRGPVVLTPHPGEWKRISGTSPRDRDAQCQAAERIAASSGVVVLLKGPRTFVTDGRRSYVNETGNPGMATGGSGDVLTGVITSLLGQGLGAFDAARLGAWVHGTAGDIAAADLGMAGVTARDVAAALPAAVQRATAEED